MDLVLMQDCFTAACFTTTGSAIGLLFDELIASKSNTHQNVGGQ
jgi:hypothetical protein